LLPRSGKRLVDLILSSGFLAFARHLGVLEALRERNIEADALVGTSSGALVGALVQAGVELSAIADLLGGAPPLRSLSLSPRPWRGLFSTAKAVKILNRHLPERFEDLPKPFAVGVCDDQGTHHLIHEGELMPALLASMAIPRVFPSVRIAGRTYVDGGVADRAGVHAWRRWRPDREAIVHIVARSHGRHVHFDAVGTLVIRTPRSGAQFWSLGDFAGQQREARQLADVALGR
jgi:predicted acylesterase/phospholipase RssA